MNHIQMQRLPLISNCLASAAIHSFLICWQQLLPTCSCLRINAVPSFPSFARSSRLDVTGPPGSVCLSISTSHRRQPCLALFRCVRAGGLDALGSVVHQCFLLSFFYRLPGLSEMHVCPVLVLPSTLPNTRTCSCPIPVGT